MTEDHTHDPMPRWAILAHIRDTHGYHGPDAPSTTGHEREANMLAWHRAAHLAAQAPSPPA